MKKKNTSIRLKEIMQERNLKQVDILKLAKPYAKQHNIKLNKSDLSQYISGKTEPGQDKLFILGLALNVNESWLMGFDVPQERYKTNETTAKLETAFYDAEIDGINKMLQILKGTNEYQIIIEIIKELDKFNLNGLVQIHDYIDFLISSKKYASKYSLDNLKKVAQKRELSKIEFLSSNNELSSNVAHAAPSSIPKESKHDNNIMDNADE